MNGPDCYRMAESLLRSVSAQVDVGVSDSVIANIIADAQVYATLALVAATVDQTAARGPGDVGPGWIEATR